MQNALAIGGVMLLPTGLGLTGVAAARLVRALQQRRRRSMATGPSFERLAADLRRLHAQLALADEPVPRPGREVRIRATRAAYVDTLVGSCVRTSRCPFEPRRPVGGGEQPGRPPVLLINGR